MDAVTSLDELQVRVVPGDGVVGRAAGVMGVAFPASVEQNDLAQQFFAAARAAAGQADAGRRCARATAGLLAQAAEGSAPALGLVGSVDGGIAVLLHGDVEFTWRSASGTQETLTGRDAATWLDRIIDEVPTMWSLARVGSGAADEWSDLQAGATRGDGLAAGGTTIEPLPAPAAATEAPAAPEEPDTLVPAPSETPAAPPPQAPAPPVSTAERVPTPAAAPEPTPAADFVAVSLAEPVAEEEAPRAPLPVATPDEVIPPPPAPEEEAEPEAPIVQGVVCKRGHFNDPNSPFCATCGISMVQQTHNLVDGPRPPLGVLVLDDGSTYVVDRDLVIGREPAHDPAVQTGEVRGVELPDPERSISRVHARIHLEGWDVLVVDAGSANGTFVAERDATQWTSVPPDRPAPLSPGMHVLVGQRVLSFDSHRRN